MSNRQKLKQSLREKCSSPDFWAHCFLFLCLSIAFWPITMWFASSANDQSRLLHALIILAGATGLLVLYSRITVRDPFTLNTSARRALIASYALLVVDFSCQRFFAQSPDLSATLTVSLLSLLSIPAYCFGIAAIALFIFGEGVKRITVTVSSTLCAFLLLSLSMEFLDWPLRTLAGKWSGAALQFIGKTVELGVTTGADQLPQLILVVDEYPFHVASECNGFGVILTSLLLSVLLAIYRKRGSIDTVLNIMAGVTLGFIFNTLRILLIVLLAPSMMEHYHLMHEIIGTITYWGCLYLVWILMNGPIKDEPA